MDNNIKPSVYCRYVDDIFVIVRNEEHLITLKERMEAGSVLNFTYETSINGKILFLDVCVAYEKRSHYMVDKKRQIIMIRNYIY